MNEYQIYKTNRASLRAAMPSESADYFGISTGINPTEGFSPQSIRAAIGLFASICGEQYTANDILFVNEIKYYPAEF